MKMIRCWAGLVFVLSLALTSLTHAQTWVHEKLLYENSLKQDMEDDFVRIVNKKGQYGVKGWKGYADDSKLILIFKDRLPQVGSIEFKITNLDPSDRVTESVHTFCLLSSSWDNPLDLAGRESWIYMRTSKDYVGPKESLYFKVDVAPNGYDTREQRFTNEDQYWIYDREYHVKILFDYDHAVVFFDGIQTAELHFDGQTERFKYLFLGGDYKYTSIQDVEFSELKVYTIEPEANTFFLDKTYTKNMMGIGAPGHGGHGLTVGDVNGDGREDVYIGNCMQGGCRRDVLLIQQADGTFVDETEARGVTDECCSHGVIFFDADNDGDLDLFNANTWEPNQLYINDGSGYFTEESFSRGIENIDGETRGAVVFDVNNDGWLDIFAVNWGMKHEMYINDGTGRFKREDRGADGVVEDPEVIGTQGVTVADIDNDGDYDIYISKRDKDNELYLNEGGYFTEVADERNVDVHKRSDGATFADYDNDGDMDLFVNNTRQSGQKDLTLFVFENDGSGYFTERTEEYNMLMDGFSTQLMDIDNDGDLDLYRLINNDYQRTVGGRLDLNDGNGNFTSTGLDGSNVIGADARAVSYVDFDNDGDLDFYITTKLFENIYLENQIKTTNKYLKVDLVGPAGDVGGVGSKVDVYSAGHIGDPRYLLGHREVTTVVGYLSGSGLTQHFGLGGSSTCDVQVTFTNGAVAERLGVSANQKILIEAPQDYNVINYVSGNNQTGTTNQVLPQPLKVRVTDQDGAPVSNAMVSFVVTQGGGSISGASNVYTDGNGYASANFQLGPTAGEHLAEARLTGAKNSPIHFTATAQAASLVLTKVSGDNQMGPVGAVLPQQLAVQANLDNGSTAPYVDVTFTVISGGGSINGNPTTVVQADEFGRAAVSWTLGTVSGQQVMRASVSGSSVDFYGTATAGNPAALLKVSGDGQNVEPGAQFPQPYVTKVTDLYGNPVPGHPVTYSVTAGGGTVNGAAQATVNTDLQGVAYMSWVAGPYYGAANSLQARSVYQGVDLGNSPVSWSYPGADVSASQSIVTATSPVPANGVSTSTIQITLKNSQNQSAGAGLTVDVLASGSGNTITIANPQTDANGQVTATLASVVPETKIVTAVVKGLELELSSRPNVVFQPVNQTPDKIEIVSGNNQNVPVTENSQPLVVKVFDTQARPMINYDVTFVVTAGEGTLNGQSTQIVKTDVEGLASVVFQTGKVAGVFSRIEARAANTSNSPATFNISSVAGDPRGLAIVSGNNQQGPPNKELPQPLAVRVVDAYSNPVTNYPVQFTVNMGSCTLTGERQITVYTSGEGIASVKAKTGENQGQVLIEAKTSFSSVSFSLMVTEGLPDPDLKLSKITATSPILADGLSASDIVVTIKDKYDRPIEGAKVQITAMGEGVKLMQPDSMTNVDGKLFAKLAATVEGEKVLLASVLPQNLYIEQTATVRFERGNPNVELISGQGQSGTVGQKSAEPLVVLLKNGNNPYAGQFIRFTVQSGGGHFNGQDTVLIKTDSQGLAYADFFFGTTAGANIVHAATPIAPDKGVTFTMHGMPAQAVKLVKQSGDEQSGNLNSALKQKLTVLVTDNFNNPTPDAAVTFSAIDGGSIAAPQTVMADSAGLAQATAMCGSTIGRYTFKAELPNGAFVLFSATAEQNNTPPNVLSYLPVENELSFSYNDRLLFEITQVFDQDNDPIYYYWHINNQMVGNQAKLVLFMSPVFGDNATLTCTVSDGNDSTFVSWSLKLDTRVELSSFSAAAMEKSGVLLKWATASERENLGFRILRSTSRNGDYKAITEKLIEPRGDGNYQFIDSDQLQPGDYFYTLESVATSGRATQHGPVLVSVQAPKEFALMQNYPNPFNPTTTFAFELPTTTQVRLVIYNQKGQLVRKLLDHEMTAGFHTLVWDAKDAFGVQVPTGIYLYRMTAGDFSETRKLTLMK